MSELDTQTGDTGAIFDLDLPDKELLEFIQSPLTESDAYWNETFGLREVRSDNMKLWLPEHWKDQSVYDYQEQNLYQNPRTFVSVETICSVVNARIAMPVVSPGTDTPTSVALADNVGKALYAHSEKFETQDIFRIVVRNLMLKRIGWIKLRFDPSISKIGEIVPELVLPEDIIVDKDARWNEIPRFIAQRIREKTFEELLALFPDAEQKIFKMAGANRKDAKGNLVAYKSQLAKKQTIYEVWFKYYDQEIGQYGGGLMWVDDQFQEVLGKMKNPNWIEDEDKEGISNLLEQPEPPFIPINYLNDGSSYIDLTTMVEQAKSQQMIHDRRGFQIMENADQAGSGLVFNTTMITKDDIAKLSGSPDERIGVKGDVRAAVTRVAPPPLPQYVIEDKIYSAQQIDDIFGTHDISRGKQSGNKTLGQDQLQVNQDYTRMDDISRALERMARRYYRYLAQMMKVYYTEEHWFKYSGEDGQYDFVMMKSDLIEDGIDITIEAGSTMPLNKERQMSFAADLAKMGLIDPLTLYEVGAGGSLPSPKKMLERLMKFKTDPMSFAGMAASDEVDTQALMDIQVLNRGEMPIARDDYTTQYLNYFNKYMTTAEYQKAIAGKPEIKDLYAKHLVAVQYLLQEQLAMMESQMPTQDEMAASNQNAVQQAAMAQQAQGGGQQPTRPGQPPQPGQRPPTSSGGSNPFLKQQNPGQVPPTGQPPAPGRPLPQQMQM